MTTSPLARQVPGVRDPRLGRLRKPWGLLVHTTGGGITDLAKKKHERPIDVALRVYINSQNGSNGYFWGGPGYVLDHDGELYCMAPDDVLTAHAGGGNRPAYIGGTWASLCSTAVVAAWREQWPRHTHPYQLFPGKSPNGDYVGLEMIPIGDGFGGSPMAPGLRFTAAQHDAVVALGRDLATRHGWPEGWQHGSRLVGHEDVDPINRHDKGGGWDPGWLRERHYFDFEYVRSGLG
jgi:hypothetical protein